MYKLQGSSYKSYKECLREEKDNDRWQNVNISMKSQLVDDIDSTIKTMDIPYNSRSRLLRKWIREKLYSQELSKINCASCLEEMTEMIEDVFVCNECGSKIRVSFDDSR